MGKSGKLELGTVDKMNLNIERASNGIIIHQQRCGDFKTLAVQGHEHEEIGKIIYNWLMKKVVNEHGEEIFITNFDIQVRCTCQGEEL